jgi:alkylhydroperoxidase family enzyme
MPDAFISPPQRMPLLLRMGVWFAERTAGRRLLPARILAWYPRAAVGSGVLESLVAHHEPGVSQRLLKIVRIQTSFAVNCAFCIDMNAYRFDDLLTEVELRALQGLLDPGEVPSFTEREQTAIRYALLISASPLHFPADFVDELKRTFDEREIVILASTAAQVNYWARLIQALGIPPVGFMETCEI